MKRFVTVRILILVFALLLGVIPASATGRPYARASLFQRLGSAQRLAERRGRAISLTAAQGLLHRTCRGSRQIGKGPSECPWVQC